MSIARVYSDWYDLPEELLRRIMIDSDNRNTRVLETRAGKHLVFHGDRESFLRRVWRPRPDQGRVIEQGNVEIGLFYRYPKEMFDILNTLPQDEKDRATSLYIGSSMKFFPKLVGFNNIDRLEVIHDVNVQPGDLIGLQSTKSIYLTKTSPNLYSSLGNLIYMRCEDGMINSSLSFLKLESLTLKQTTVDDNVVLDAPRLTRLGLSNTVITNPKFFQSLCQLNYLKIFTNKATLPIDLFSSLKSLETLVLEAPFSLTMIPNIDHLPLKTLELGHNKLDSLPLLPSSLIRLVISYNKLLQLPPLPVSLEDLLAVGNQLTSIPPLPPSMKILVLDRNRLTRVPQLPSSLIQLTLLNNPLVFEADDFSMLSNVTTLSIPMPLNNEKYPKGLFRNISDLIQLRTGGTLQFDAEAFLDEQNSYLDD
jgi:hypothetical protein